MYDVGNGEIKCTTVLCEHERYIGTDGLPHFLESLICMNIWNLKKFTQTFGHAYIKGASACAVQKGDLDTCHGSSST